MSSLLPITTPKESSWRAFKGQRSRGLTRSCTPYLSPAGFSDLSWRNWVRQKLSKRKNKEVTRDKWHRAALETPHHVDGLLVPLPTPRRIGNILLRHYFAEKSMNNHSGCACVLRGGGDGDDLPHTATSYPPRARHHGRHPLPRAAHVGSTQGGLRQAWGSAPGELGQPGL